MIHSNLILYKTSRFPSDIIWKSDEASADHINKEIVEILFFISKD